MPTATLSARRLVGIVALALAMTVAVSPSRTGASTSTIAARNFQFSPDSVSVSVGDTVSWTFSGAPHTVTSGVPGAPDGHFDSGIVNPGGTFTLTFSMAGTSPYFCRVHPERMSGTVVVAALPGGGPTPGPTPRPTPGATAAPTPTPGPTPRPTARATATPTPSVPPTASASPPPAVTPTGVAPTTVTPSASRVPSVAPLPVATSTAGPSPVDAGDAGGGLPAALIGLGLLVLVAGGALVRARRRRR